jgi:uncharacterized protein (TIGR03086 family)
MAGMDLLDAQGLAIAAFDQHVRAVLPDQWDGPTPCSEWTVRDLVRHVVSAQRMVPWRLRGATTEDVGDRYDGDVLGPDPVQSWAQASSTARGAWLEVDALRRQVDDGGRLIPASVYGWRVTGDLTVHAWDLARAIGADGRIDPELALDVYAAAAPNVPAWQAIGAFGASLPAPGAGDPQARLLALLGRDPRWTPAG